MAGRPVRVDNKPLELIEIFRKLNVMAGEHAVGGGVHVVENRVVGIKSRGVYEAPAMTLIAACYEFLLQLVLDANARSLFSTISTRLGRQIYAGEAYDLAAAMMRSAVAQVAKLIAGKVTVHVCCGSVSYVAAEEVDHSLYDSKMSTMEESDGFDHADSEGYLRVLMLGARALARAGQVANRYPSS